MLLADAVRHLRRRRAAGWRGPAQRGSGYGAGAGSEHAQPRGDSGFRSPGGSARTLPDEDGEHESGYAGTFGTDSEQSRDPRARMRQETDAQRIDRNYAELVQELRVAQTGVQILFAFLLSLAFLSDFPRGDTVFAAVLSGALVTAACAACTIIAPVAWHRLLFGQQRKDRLLRMVHYAALIGLAQLLVSIAGAAWLVLAFLWGMTAASWSALSLVVAVSVMWFLLPRPLARQVDSESTG